MKQITVGSKNQIVIPKEVREKIKGLRMGTKVSIYSLDKDSFVVKVDKKDWASRTYGKMRESLKNINVLDEINKMRDEW